MGRDKENRGGSEILTTISTYDRIADDFRKHTLDEGDRDYQEALLRRTMDMLCPSPRILDLGCGDGRDTSFLNSLGADATGLDLSHSMIRLARKNYPDCTFVLGDMRRTPFHDDTFHCVWASASVIHIPKRELSMVEREIHRVLRPEGILSFSFKEGTGEGYQNDPYNEPRYYSYYTLHELEQRLSSFRSLSHETYPGEIMGNRFTHCWLRAL